MDWVAIQFFQFLSGLPYTYSYVYVELIWANHEYTKHNTF